MKKKPNVIRKVAPFLVGVLLVVSSLTVSAAERPTVKMTNKEYAVTIDGANNLFMSNEKAISGKVGSTMYLTYTVEEVTTNFAMQNGVLATRDNESEFPYAKEGTMCFDDSSVLYEKGYTYVFRFERTKEGFEYECAKLKGEEAVSVTFRHDTQASKDDDYTYFGIWTTSGTKPDRVSASLNHVRCYDENGNDLGIHFNNKTGYKNDKLNTLFNVHPTVNSSYAFEVEDLSNIAICNKYAYTGDVMYFEYTVKSVAKDTCAQHGAMATGEPRAVYPFQFGKGLLRLNVYDGDTKAEDKLLLREGAKYFICMVKEDGSFRSYVQCTKDGKTETSTFTNVSGVYNDSYPYYGLWFDGKVSAVFEDVKCFDAQGNSLGIQINKLDVQLSHSGEAEDYSRSQAVYYCKENGSMIELADKKNAVLHNNGQKVNYTYNLQDDTVLYLISDAGKIAYEYNPLMIKDEDKNTYKRLKESKVRFVTGDEIIEVTATANNGYRVEEPAKPSQDGKTFKGWYRGDGTAFDFSEIVTATTTLYAKWEDGDGNVYLAVDQEIASTIDISMVISIVVTAVLVVGFTVGGIGIVRRKKKA